MGTEASETDGCGGDSDGVKLRLGTSTDDVDSDRGRESVRRGRLNDPSTNDPGRCRCWSSRWKAGTGTRRTAWGFQSDRPSSASLGGTGGVVGIVNGSINASLSLPLYLGGSATTWPTSDPESGSDSESSLSSGSSSGGPEMGGALSQIPGASQSTRNNVGPIPKLGQNTNSRLLRGILVSLLRWAVAFINSTTVCRRSWFSRGRRETRSPSVSTSDAEGARREDDVGRVNVDKEGGLRSMGISLGPDGSVWGLGLMVLCSMPLGDTGAARLLSALMAASKRWPRARVRIGSGTVRGTTMRER